MPTLAIRSRAVLADLQRSPKQPPTPETTGHPNPSAEYALAGADLWALACLAFNAAKMLDMAGNAETAAARYRLAARTFEACDSADIGDIGPECRRRAAALAATLAGARGDTAD